MTSSQTLGTISEHSLNRRDSCKSHLEEFKCALKSISQWCWAIKLVLLAAQSPVWCPHIHCAAPRCRFCIHHVFSSGPAQREVVAAHKRRGRIYIQHITRRRAHTNPFRHSNNVRPQNDSIIYTKNPKHTHLAKHD